MKNFAILESENKEIIEAIQKYFEGKCKVISKDADLNGYDLLVLTGYEYEFTPPQGGVVLNLHPSLLPSFRSMNALKESYLSGVKVSGVTVHYVEHDNFYGRILAQCPVLIGNSTHFDEFEQEITAVAQKLYPPVIDAVLKDRVFDFGDLFKSSCHSKNCNGCGGHGCGDCCR